MAHKHLFASSGKAPKTDTRNEAGGQAHAFSAKHALAQYAVTGTFHSTYYANESEQLDKVLELCGQVPSSFVAKTALYTRQKGFMKDMPAFLAAYLAAHDVAALAPIFSRVVDSGKMLRNFVQIVRSGVTGRKSLGSAPKRLVQQWFSGRSPENVFRQSLGSDPSLADVIKLARPAPGEDAARRALYGWLIGKEVAHGDLPPLVQAFEAYKKGDTANLPDVPFEMLTALPLGPSAWKQLAKNMSWTQLRMNLNTLARHDVLADEAMVKWVADALSDATKVRRARAFPYQLLAAYKAASAVPPRIQLALQQAMEIAIENVPEVEGKVYVCPDVSGSMHSPVTGHRGGGTSAVRCIDVAALVGAAFLRKNPHAEVIPFSDDVVPMGTPLNPLDSVMTNAQKLAALPSGGTACSAPLRHLVQAGRKGDLVVYVSDNMSWVDFTRDGGRRGTAMAKEWARFSESNRGAKLVLIDIQPYSSTQVKDDPSVLNVGGFSDRVFEIVALFAEGKLGPGHWVQEIEAMEV